MQRGRLTEESPWEFQAQLPVSPQSQPFPTTGNDISSPCWPEVPQISTLVQILRTPSPPALLSKHKAVVKLLRRIHGMLPRYYHYFALSQDAFKTALTLYSSLLNFPLILFGGGVSEELLAMVIVVASRHFKCLYCTAHTTYSALHSSHVSPDKVIAAANYVPRTTATPMTVTATMSSTTASIFTIASSITTSITTSMCPADPALIAGTTTTPASPAPTSATGSSPGSTATHPGSSPPPVGSTSKPHHLPDPQIPTAAPRSSSYSHNSPPTSSTNPSSTVTASGTGTSSSPPATVALSRGVGHTTSSSQHCGSPACLAPGHQPCEPAASTSGRPPATSTCCSAPGNCPCNNAAAPTNAAADTTGNTSSQSQSHRPRVLPAGYSFTPLEMAAMDVAACLSHLNSDFDLQHKATLLTLVKPEHAEWLIMGIALMGLYNKFTDALGVELEFEVLRSSSYLLRGKGWEPGKHFNFPMVQQELMHMVLTPQGSSPGTSPLTKATARKGWLGRAANRLAMLPLLLGVNKDLTEWKQGVPDRWPQVGTFLRKHTGCSFEYLQKMKLNSCIQAVATAVVTNWRKKEGGIPLPVKALAGFIAAAVLGNLQLCDMVCEMARTAGVPSRWMAAAAALAAGEFRTVEEAYSGLGAAGIDPAASTALVLARLLSQSPVVLVQQVVERAKHELSPEGVVDLVVWVGLQQVHHRLMLWFQG